MYEGFGYALSAVFGANHKEQDVADPFSSLLGEGGEGMKGDESTNGGVFFVHIADGGGGIEHLFAKGGFKATGYTIKAVVKLKRRGGEPVTHLQKNREFVGTNQTNSHTHSSLCFFLSLRSRFSMARKV